MRHMLALRGKGGPTRVPANEFAYVDELWRRWSPAWKDIPASETQHVKRAFAQPGCVEAACAYYTAHSARLALSHRSSVKMPAVAFAGEDDVLSPRVFEKARHCYAASYEVVIMPGGHFMHREHPEPFTTELVRALRDHTSSA
jgi:pimeloyl-ACP methyl ester carboxylesterase